MLTDLSTVPRRQGSVDDSSDLKNPSVVASGDPRLRKLKKSLYQSDQQVKYLHLQAEVESLLQQLQTLKQQRLAPTPSGVSSREQRSKGVGVELGVRPEQDCS